MASTGRVLATAAAKQAAAAGGALAVEMESAGVAAIAAARRIPFVSLRVVLDRADDAVPALGGVIDDYTGEVRLARAVGLVLRPRDWGGLARLARATRVAERRLRGVVAGVVARGLAGLGLAGDTDRAVAR